MLSPCARPQCLIGGPGGASSSSSPICVSPKPKVQGTKRSKNIFFDDCGFPDESEEYYQLFHNINGGIILRKKKFPTPPLKDIDPEFNWVYSEELHGEKLRTGLDLSHLSPEQAAALMTLIKEFWCVFDKRGTFIPICNYERNIDTGTSRPIAIKQILFRPREIPIMQKSIAALAKVGQIWQIHDGQWLFKALLVPKPHQEHVCNIEKFVWRFCVNYIPLNQVTWQIAYPIPHCDAAVEGAFGGQWIWLYNPPMGYHQISASKETQEKLAFQGPDAIEWTYTVMPFRPTNGPATFVTMIMTLTVCGRRKQNQKEFMSVVVLTPLLSLTTSLIGLGCLRWRWCTSGASSASVRLID